QPRFQTFATGVANVILKIACFLPLKSKRASFANEVVLLSRYLVGAPMPQDVFFLFNTDCCGWDGYFCGGRIRSKSLFLSSGSRPYSLLWMLIHASELAV
ncbi:MAG: hypothetical protein ACI4UA_06030, partial [Bacteroidaceae bacterium]